MNKFDKKTPITQRYFLFKPALKYFTCFAAAVDDCITLPVA